MLVSPTTTDQSLSWLRFVKGLPCSAKIESQLILCDCGAVFPKSSMGHNVAAIVNVVYHLIYVYYTVYMCKKST